MEKKKYFTRYTALSIILIVMFSALCFKLADLQIVHGDEFLKQAQDKSIREIPYEAPRGEIIDRNGYKFATNVQSYTIFMMKPEDDNKDAGSKKESGLNAAIKNMLGASNKEATQSDDSGKPELNDVIERLLDILNKDKEKINDDFRIILKTDGSGKTYFDFDFNSTDEKEREKSANDWIKKNIADEKVRESLTDGKIKMTLQQKAEKAFNELVDEFDVKPKNKNHQNLNFKRQMVVVNQMIKDMGYQMYKPVEIAYVSQSTAFEIMEKSLYLPGVDYRLKPLRTYPYGELASLIVGSLRKIPAEKSDEYKAKEYDINSDLIGRDGIESAEEDKLRGTKGNKRVRVDAKGRVTEEFPVKDSIPGKNVMLTIDKNLQQVAENSLDNVMKDLRTGQGGLDKKKYPNATRGAAVVLDVKTGEVLAMASRPGGYNPNDMAANGSINQSLWKKLSGDKSLYPDIKDPERIPKPMFNYATQGAVPPGSTFKMISAITGLETGQITPYTRINCVGQYRVVKNFTGNCWIWNYHPGRGHGWQVLRTALENSCNYFFFDVGRRVGLDNLAKYAKLFGLSNDPTGIEIAERPGNVSNVETAKEKAVAVSLNGILRDICEPNYDPKIGKFNPTPEQKTLIENMLKNNDRSYSKLKDAGITSAKMRDRIIQGVIAAYHDYNNQWLALNAAIGQGDDYFTPLQMANYVATIANGGVRLKPHLVKQILSQNGEVLDSVKPEVMEKINLKPSTLPAVIAGMNAVTGGETGTAVSAFKNFPIQTAGKTGTAQATGKRDDYSWFVGFAPADNPQIAVAVTIHEGGGHGGANVARDIYEYYFKLNTGNQAAKQTTSHAATN